MNTTQLKTQNTSITPEGSLMPLINNPCPQPPLAGNHYPTF